MEHARIIEMPVGMEIIGTLSQERFLGHTNILIRSRAS
jgi:hypothetical protein